MPVKKTISSSPTEKKYMTKTVKASNTKNVSNTKDVSNTKEDHHNLDHSFENHEVNDSKKNIVRKTGRTLLVSPSNGSYLNGDTFSKLEGLTTSHSTKNGSYFLTFENVNHALESFRSLRQDHPELRVKFARYQIFFTISGLTDSYDYSTVKQNMCNFIEKETGTDVLYFKLYRKGDKYIGCGDLTVDTKDTMDKLLNKEGPLKNYTIGELSGSFYRYNKTQSNTHNENHEHV